MRTRPQLRSVESDQRRNNESGEDRIGRYRVETKKVGIGGILSRRYSQ